MSQQQFEDYIRKNVGNYPSPMDNDNLWLNIKDKIPQRRRRRGLFWIWFLGSAFTATALVGGVYLWTQAAKSDSGIISTSPSDEIENAVLKLDGQLPITKQDSAYSQNLEKQGTIKETETYRPVFEAVKTKTKLKQNNTRDYQIEKSVANSNQNAASIPSSNYPIIESNAIEQDFTLIQPFETIDPLKIKKLAYNFPPPPKMERLPALGNHSRRNFFLGIEAQASLFSTGRRLTATDSLQDYRQQRINTEELLETISASIHLSVEHRMGFYFKTGLSWTKMSEKFQFNDAISETDSIDGIREIFINENGDSSFVFGKIPITRNTLFEKRTYNSWTLLDLPVIAGYTFGEAPFSLGIEGGVFVNVQVSKEGQILDPGDGFYDLEEDNDAYFKTNVGLSYYGALRINYQLYPNISVYFSPQVRYFPDSFSTSTNPVQQEYHLFGAGLGVKYTFE